MTDEDPGDLALVYPYVVCVTAGGPYDDDSFVAGAQCAEIDQLLGLAATIGASSFHKVVFAELVPQLDLVAMHYGYVMTHELWAADPEWSVVTFTRAEDDST